MNLKVGDKFKFKYSDYINNMNNSNFKPYTYNKLYTIIHINIHTLIFLNDYNKKDWIYIDWIEKVNDCLKIKIRKLKRLIKK